MFIQALCNVQNKLKSIFLYFEEHGTLCHLSMKKVIYNCLLLCIQTINYLDFLFVSKGLNL